MFLKYNFKLLSSKDYLTGYQLCQKDNALGSEIPWGSNSSSMLINTLYLFQNVDNTIHFSTNHSNSERYRISKICVKIDPQKNQVNNIILLLP